LKIQKHETAAEIASATASLLDTGARGGVPRCRTTCFSQLYLKQPLCRVFRADLKGNSYRQRSQMTNIDAISAWSSFAELRGSRLKTM
jgi:hypothetical protein